MTEIPGRRQYQERFLDGSGRGHLREAMQAIKPKRFGRFRRRYALWMLGASLAFGGLAAPLHTNKTEAVLSKQPASSNGALGRAIAGDLSTARQIADQVAGGAASGLQDAASLSVHSTEDAATVPQALTADANRLRFFSNEVPFGQIIYREAKKNDIAPELLAAVVQTESKYVPTHGSR